MNLAQALRVTPQTRLGMVGAGGKTSALFQTARALLQPDLEGSSTVLVSVTTHLAYDQIKQADRHFFVRSLEDLLKLEKNLPAGLVLITGPRSPLKDHPNRVTGLGTDIIARLLAIANERRFPLLIEADGSKRLPLKAPAEYEPALPDFVNQVVVVAGLSGLGKPLNSQWVHRPERFAALTGLSPEALVSDQALVKVLLHPEGGLRNIPIGARRVALLNQADTPKLRSIARQMATQLLTAYDSVAIASLNLNPPLNGEISNQAGPGIQQSRIYAVHEPVAGIVLAAGGSSRFGQTKQLLPWQGQPLVRHVTQLALQAGLSPVIVVAGQALDQIREILKDLPAIVVHNPGWEAGQSTSVRAGLNTLPRPVGAAIFLLSDQPRVTPDLLQKLVETHAHSLATIVAPQVDGRPANPVLFDQMTFPDFANIRGDLGGRQLFSKYPISWVPWHDGTILLDIDTPEDYQRLLETGYTTYANTSQSNPQNRSHRGR